MLVRDSLDTYQFLTQIRLSFSGSTALLRIGLDIALHKLGLDLLFVFFGDVRQDLLAAAVKRHGLRVHQRQFDLHAQTRA